MEIKLDYQKTNQKCRCHVCGKNIKKGDIRFGIDNMNTYYREKKYYHLKCIEHKIEIFKNQIPVNNLEL